MWLGTKVKRTAYGTLVQRVYGSFVALSRVEAVEPSCVHAKAQRVAYETIVLNRRVATWRLSRSDALGLSSSGCRSDGQLPG
jgi:hypothetical protein